MANLMVLDSAIVDRITNPALKPQVTRNTFRTFDLYQRYSQVARGDNPTTFNTDFEAAA